MNDSDKNKDALLRLIDSLAYMNDENWEKGGASNFARSFSEYYASGGINKYSVTYRWVQTTNHENFEYLLYRIKSVDTILKEQHSTYTKTFEKLMDYINLEISRAENVRDLKKQALEAGNFLEQSKKIASQVKNVKEKLKEELWEEKKSSNIQAVTVLGIFTGIVMSFFGSFKLFESALGNLTSQNDYKLIFLISFIGFVFFNSVFLLIFASAKVGNNRIHLDCKYGECKDAKGNVICSKGKEKACGILGRLFHGYTFVLFVDIVIILTMVVTGYFYFSHS